MTTKNPSHNNASCILHFIQFSTRYQYSIVVIRLLQKFDSQTQIAISESLLKMNQVTKNIVRVTVRVQFRFYFRFGKSLLVPTFIGTFHCEHAKNPLMMPQVGWHNV